MIIIHLPTYSTFKSV